MRERVVDSDSVRRRASAALPVNTSGIISLRLRSAQIWLPGNSENIQNTQSAISSATPSTNPKLRGDMTTLYNGRPWGDDRWQVERAALYIFGVPCRE